MLFISLNINQHIVISFEDQEYRLVLTDTHGGFGDAFFILETIRPASRDRPQARGFMLDMKDDLEPLKPELPDVSVQLREVLPQRATLAFSAPRRISIQGSWKREPSQCNTQLSSLTDKELVIHTHQLGKTDLEIELAKRLESKRGTL